MKKNCVISSSESFLLQSDSNSTDIYNNVVKLLDDKQALENQVTRSQEVIRNFKKCSVLIIKM